MKKKVAILTTSFSILASTIYPLTTYAYTPDTDGKFVSPSAIKGLIQELEQEMALKLELEKAKAIPTASFDTDKLIQVSKKYIGIHYQVAGKSPSGFDCSGFVGYVFKKSADIKLPGSSDDIYDLGVPINKEDLQAGDLVFFNTNNRTISHVGIYIGEGKFIHSQSSNGITITSLSQKYYADRYQGAKRI